MEKTTTTTTWRPNEKHAKILAFLSSHATEKFTLAQISKEVSFEVKSGLTNTLVSKGLITCNKNDIEIVCPCCGHKKKVSSYQIVDTKKEGAK